MSIFMALFLILLLAWILCAPVRHLLSGTTITAGHATHIDAGSFCLRQLREVSALPGSGIRGNASAQCIGLECD